jgi:hypothetical protein
MVLLIQNSKPAVMRGFGLIKTKSGRKMSQPRYRVSYPFFTCQKKQFVFLGTKGGKDITIKVPHKVVRYCDCGDKCCLQK